MPASIIVRRNSSVWAPCAVVRRPRRSTALLEVVVSSRTLGQGASSPACACAATIATGPRQLSIRVRGPVNCGASAVPERIAAILAARPSRALRGS